MIRCAFFSLLVITALFSELAAQEKEVQLANGSFEQVVNGKPIGWSFNSNPGFELSIVKDNALVGERCACVEASGDAAGSFINLGQSFDLDPWQGKTVRFRASVRVLDEQGNGRAQLWFRVDGARTGEIGNTLAFDNMQDRPITSDDWQYYEITSKIPENAKKLFLGMLVFPACKAFIDDVTLEPIDDDQETETTTDAFQSSNSRRAAIAGQSTGPPLINHWLWLVAITLLLFFVSQFGWLNGHTTSENTDPHDSEVQARANGWLLKFALRFSVVYWLLYCLPSPLQGVFFGWETKVVSWYSDLMKNVDRWTADNLLGITREFPAPRGSGDMTRDFVHLFVCFGIAIAVGMIWASVDGRKTNDRWTNDLLRSYLRYVLAFTMLGYGLAKIGMVMNQFPEPGIDQLHRTWGQSPPQNVIWNFMGTSRPYTIFAGMGEVVGCLLLIWRRTATLGAMVTFGVMLNVVMLNFCYDIPVKQYSFHLMIMAIIILLPEAHRLGNVLFWNRPTSPVDIRPPYTGKNTIWLQRLFKAYLIVVGVGFPIYTKIKTELNPPTSRLGEPTWFGEYEVDEFFRGGERIAPYTDRERWKTMSISRYAFSPTGGSDPTDYLYINKTVGGAGGPSRIDINNNTIQCGPISQHELRLTINGDDIVEIIAGTGQDEIRAQVHRLRREDYLIFQQRFRWVRE